MTQIDQTEAPQQPHPVLAKVVFVGLAALGYAVGLVAILIPIVNYILVVVDQ